MNSSFLVPHHITHLEINEGDKQILKAILEMTLSEDTLLKVSSGTSTQKCEALNSSTASTLRKGVNYSRRLPVGYLLLQYSVLFIVESLSLLYLLVIS